MNDKKYYSVSEVSKILKIYPHQLRYLEKILPKITVYKIRNRKYYTANDIKLFKSYILKNMENAQLAMLIEPQKSENLVSNFIKFPPSGECVREMLLDEPDMLTSTYYLQNEYDASNQVKTYQKLLEKPLEVSMSSIDKDMPLFTLANVACKNGLSEINADLAQPSVMKLSGDRVQKIDNLIKNFQDLSLFIKQALSS